MSTTGGTPIQSRPYRSHRVPACIRCRSRKIRCHIDIPGEPCLSCRERRLKCQYTDQPVSPGDSNGQSGTKRRRLSNGDADENEPARPRSAPILHKASSNPSASIILAPHMAEDVDILQRHMSRHRAANVPSEADSYQTLNHDIDNPIVYLTVPRFRTGLAPELGAGKEQLEIIQQLMGPFKKEVVELFFTNVHSNFPVLDAHTCALLKKGEHENLSKSLVCVVYAIATPYWNQSDTLKMHPKPDQHYIWNKAIGALLEDERSPSMATVTSSILDQIGRPSVSIIGNTTLCGYSVSLSQCFGLHRNPAKWNITDHEKALRIRTWWGVLITDYWTSIAYGVLPHISKRFYDVPLPTLEPLLPAKPTPAQRYATTCFIHLCSLTELLGEILPLVYVTAPDRTGLSQSVEKLKADLNDLEGRLPVWLPLPHKPGSSNLWFCFLSMRLLLSRVALRAAILEGNANREAMRLGELRTASSAVLDFTLYLGEYQFLDFWLPYAAHLLVHAVTVSLRCAVEAKDVDMRNVSVARLEKVMEHIKFARDNYGWDIAEFCLDRCSDIVSKLASVTGSTALTTNNNTAADLILLPTSAIAPRSANIVDPVDPSITSSSAMPPPPLATTANGFVGLRDHQQQQQATAPLTLLNAEDESNLLLSDLLDPNAFDLSWEALWDTPSGLGNFSL